MISKQCAVCGRYFAGELNGDYACPACAAAGAASLRPLSSLDGCNDVAPAMSFAPSSERRPSAPAGRSAGQGAKVKGHAA